jgi:hypothetical protein
MGRIRRFIGALQLAALGSVASVGRAEPPAEGQRARLLATADEAMRDGRLAEARDAFLAIWQATGERDAVCNVGRLSFRIGDMPRAAEFLERCVATAPEETEETEDSRLELMQARRHVAELRIRGPAGTDITIDGKPRGRAPLVVYLAPGGYTVRGTGPGGAEAEAAVRAAAGDSKIIKLDLKAPAARPNGWIIVGGAAVSASLLGLGAALAVASYVQERAGDKHIPKDDTGCFTLSRRGCQEAGRAYEAMSTLRNWGAAGLVAGACAAGGTVVYSFFPRSRVSVSTVGTGIRVEAAW